MALGLLQYVSALVAGTFLLFVVGAYMTVAAGGSFLAVILIFAPVVLAGILSGLSFFLPRVSAALALLLSLPFAYIGFVDLISGTPFSEPLVFLIPSLVLIGVSVAVLANQKRSVWSRTSRVLTRCIVVAAAILPASFACYVAVSFLSRVTINLNV